MDTPRDDRAGGSSTEDAPAVGYVQRWLETAVQRRASDLHFEPYEHSHRLRLRIDGQLHEVDQVPSPLRERLAARIKVLARLDVAERRLPQDGRMGLHLRDGHTLDLRVSTLPTLFGEKIVIRVLDARTQSLALDDLGCPPEPLALLEHAIGQAQGMVLVTGPTGAGRTQTLYACLERLNTPARNIATVEDPCEIERPGLNQVNVQDKPGLSFALVLRAFLRQDPDVLMVGEIRDLETAQVAVQAAQTGHLVLSSLHTNDAPSTLERLRHMGVAPYLIAGSVHLITAQRLLRRLCTHCRAPHALSAQVLRQAGWDGAEGEARQLWRAVGCAHCHQGYRGRLGVFQVMPISAALQRLILEGASSSALARQARQEGVPSLRQAALRQVCAGQTTLEEALTHTPPDSP